MAVPDFQSIMLPLLQALQDGQTHRYADVAEQLADHFQLTESERLELLPSGAQRRFLNRVGWARTYLAKAGLLAGVERGSIQITNAGRSLLAEHPQRIDIRFLNRYPEFVAFRERTVQPPPKNGPGTDDGGVSSETPQELIERAHRQLQATLAEELLATIKTQSPGFFEKLVLQLLLAMGYGGTLQDAAQVVGQTGDGGIDGVIKEDKLGLDMIYVQAKRWDNVVGRPVVQGFAGSLDGYRARKGVFITTGNFSRDAHDYVDRIDKRIVLIDGPMLARLLIDHNVGVTVASSYQIKRVDSDYFGEE